MNKNDIKELIQEAFNTRENSYAPYSKYSVGAVIVTKDNKIYKGCNIENGAYPSSICAERVALFKALSEGERDFKTIVIVSEGDMPYPCGECRQVLSEFVNNDFMVIVATNKDSYEMFSFDQIMPLSFKRSK